MSWEKGQCGDAIGRECSLTVVMQKLFDQVNMGKYHAPAAIPLQLQPV